MGMNIVPGTRTALFAAVVACAAGCGAPPGGAAPASVPSERSGPSGGDAVPEAEGPPDAAAAPERGATPRRIYYRLTDFAWYLQGEPLLADGRAYAVAGPPLRIEAAALRLAGSYQGVDYYRAAPADSATVYVPVSPRYWVPFSAVLTGGSDGAVRGDGSVE